MKTALIQALLLFALGPQPAGGQPHDAWFGTWRLDAARSTQRAEPSPYKRVTLQIVPSGQDGLSVVYDMVGVRGGVTHLEWTGRFDGRDYPVQGVDYVMTNAYRRIDHRRYAIEVKVDGRPAASAVATVAPDGRTLTVDTEERAPDGRTAATRAVYIRQP